MEGGRKGGRWDTGGKGKRRERGRKEGRTMKQRGRKGETKRKEGGEDGRTEGSNEDEERGRE
jgi:hypothetical protein